MQLKAFETPSLCAALETAKDKLLESQQTVDTMRTKCSYLENEIVAKENYFASHELALKESNERELEKGKYMQYHHYHRRSPIYHSIFSKHNFVFFISFLSHFDYGAILFIGPVKLCLQETEQSAKEQIQALHFQLQTLNDEHMQSLKACQLKFDGRCSELEIQLKLSHDRETELIEQLNNFTVTENQLRDKVQASEQEFSERLHAATARERQLNEKLTQLTKQLKCEEDRRRELDERLKLVNDENQVMRQRRQTNGPTNSSNENSTPTHSMGSKAEMLAEEVESLRSVLDMKLNEISELRKQNHELQSAHDELPKALVKISVLETRLEDLSIQYQTKVDEEK